ncbi:MAG: hypothetical protein HT579_12175 [Candidatus Accumulibacter similis]|nr:MAG: hypothetical protein HT579_12175 [Candidatus Accumulibacter similis]
MSQPLPPSTPALNRLRAASALIPIIESGLADSRISVERAALMAAFCEWAAENPPDDPEAARLAESVTDGLQRIRLMLAAVS